MANSKSGVSGSKVIAGAGLALAAAAAAGAGYFFYGHKNGARHRAKAARWAKSLHADVLKKAKKIKDIDEKAFAAVVAEASKAYETVKGVDKKDLIAAGEELRASWAHIQKEISRTTKKGAKAVAGAKKKVVTSVKKAVTKTLPAAKKTVKKKK